MNRRDGIVHINQLYAALDASNEKLAESRELFAMARDELIARHRIVATTITELQTTMMAIGMPPDQSLTDMLRRTWPPTLDTIGSSAAPPPPPPVQVQQQQASSSSSSSSSSRRNEAAAVHALPAAAVPAAAQPAAAAAAPEKKKNKRGREPPTTARDRLFRPVEMHMRRAALFDAYLHYCLAILIEWQRRDRNGNYCYNDDDHGLNGGGGGGNNNNNEGGQQQYRDDEDAVARLTEIICRAQAACNPNVPLTGISVAEAADRRKHNYTLYSDHVFSAVLDECQSDPAAHALLAKSMNLVKPNAFRTQMVRVADIAATHAGAVTEQERKPFFAGLAGETVRRAISQWHAAFKMLVAKRTPTAAAAAAAAAAPMPTVAAAACGGGSSSSSDDTDDDDELVDTPVRQQHTNGRARRPADDNDEKVDSDDDDDDDDDNCTVPKQPLRRLKHARVVVAKSSDSDSDTPLMASAAAAAMDVTPM